MSELSVEDRERSEKLVLPHIDAAFNLARWLLRGRQLKRGRIKNVENNNCGMACASRAGSKCRGVRDSHR